MKKPKQRCLTKTLKTIYLFKQVSPDAGFTLIELLVVVLMVGILAAIVSPSWLAFVNKQRVNKANDAVFAALQEAQRQAKNTKRSYSVSFRTNNNIPQIVIYPNSTTVSSLSDDKWKSLGTDVQINSNKFLLGANLSSENTAGTSVSYGFTTPQTITFDYMGSLSLPVANFGTIPTGSTEAPGLKVVVTVPAPGSTTQPGSVKRCVILQTLIGGMRTAKDDDINAVTKYCN